MFESLQMYLQGTRDGCREHKSNHAKALELAKSRNIIQDIIRGSKMQMNTKKA
jgi:hypothetical protein